MTDLLTIGERIAALRIASGLSQRELGEKIGRSRSSVAQVEAGGMKPDYEFIKGVVKVCGGTYEYIIEDREESRTAIASTTNKTATENFPTLSERGVSPKQTMGVKFIPENENSEHSFSQKHGESTFLNLERSKAKNSFARNRLQSEDIAKIQTNSELESLREFMIQLTSDLKNEIVKKIDAKHLELLKKLPSLMHEKLYSETPR